MRKDILEALLLQCEAITNPYKQEDSRITDLKSYLALQENQSLTPGDDISFENFSRYLQKKNPQETLDRFFDLDISKQTRLKLIVTTSPLTTEQVNDIQKPAYVLLKKTLGWECYHYNQDKQICRIKIKEIAGMKAALNNLPEKYNAETLQPLHQIINTYHHDIFSRYNNSVETLFKKFCAAEKRLAARMRILSFDPAKRGQTKTQVITNPGVDDARSKLSSIPAAARQNIFYEMLDHRSMSLLSATSSAFYSETTRSSSWLRKLLDLGVNPSSIQTLMKSGISINYKNLYHSIKGSFDIKGCGSFSLLDLAALTGSVAAMEYAVKVLKIAPGGVGAINALSFAAKSGSVAAMEYAANVLKGAVHVTKSGQNALHFAAGSGSVSAMEYAVKNLKIAPDSVTKHGQNALHFAAGSGSVSAMEYAVKNLKIAPDSVTKHGQNALHFAAGSGSVAAMEYALKELNIAPDSVTKRGENALHFAAKSGSVSAMEYAVKNLKIAPDSINQHGENALHAAAKSGSVSVMEYAVKNLKIAPDSVNQHGENALHAAAESGSVSAMEYAVKNLKIAPDSVNQYGENALHVAAKSGSVAAVKWIRQLSHNLNLNMDTHMPDQDGHDAYWFACHSTNSAAIIKILNAPIETLLDTKENKLDEKCEEKSKIEDAKISSSLPRKPG